MSSFDDSRCAGLKTMSASVFDGVLGTSGPSLVGCLDNIG